MNTIHAFIRRLRFEKNASPNTIDAYRSDLMFCMEYLGTDLVNANKDQLFDYLVFLRTEQQLDEKSISRKISCLRSFYKDLIRLEIRKDNPMDLIDTPKMRRTLPHFISEHDLGTIFDGFQQNTDGFQVLRDAMIFEVLYSCGLRVSELCDLKMNCVYLNEKILRIIGKGDKERLVPIGTNLSLLLERYLPVRAEFLKDFHCDYLITGKFRKKVSRMFIWKVVRKYSDKTTSVQLHPHMLRHAFATHMLKYGADLRLIQELLGHSDLSTTEIYTHVEHSELTSTLNAFHPLGAENI